MNKLLPTFCLLSTDVSQVPQNLKYPSIELRFIQNFTLAGPMGYCMPFLFVNLPVFDFEYGVERDNKKKEREHTHFTHMWAQEYDV